MRPLLRCLSRLSHRAWRTGWHSLLLSLSIRGAPPRLLLLTRSIGGIAAPVLHSIERKDLKQQISLRRREALGLEQASQCLIVLRVQTFGCPLARFIDQVRRVPQSSGRPRQKFESRFRVRHGLLPIFVRQQGTGHEPPKQSCTTTTTEYAKIDDGKMVCLSLPIDLRARLRSSQRDVSLSLGPIKHRRSLRPPVSSAAHPHRGTQRCSGSSAAIAASHRSARCASPGHAPYRWPAG